MWLQGRSEFRDWLTLVVKSWSDSGDRRSSRTPVKLKLNSSQVCFHSQTAAPVFHQLMGYQPGDSNCCLEKRKRSACVAFKDLQKPQNFKMWHKPIQGHTVKEKDGARRFTTALNLWQPATIKSFTATVLIHCFWSWILLKYMYFVRLFVAPRSCSAERLWAQTEQQHASESETYFRSQTAALIIPSDPISACAAFTDPRNLLAIRYYHDTIYCDIFTLIQQRIMCPKETWLSSAGLSNKMF